MLIHFTFLQRRGILFAALFGLGLLLIMLPGGSSTGQEITPTPAPWTTYEDTDPLLVYTGTWQTFPVSGAVGGNLTGTDDPDATLTLYFEGTGIRLISSAGPEGAPFEALLDNEWAQFPSSYAANYTYGQVTAFEDLDSGRHTLTVSNGSGAIWIEAVQVQGTLTTAPQEPELGLRFSDNFDDDYLGGWSVSWPVEELLVPHNEGKALRIPGKLQSKQVSTIIGC